MAATERKVRIEPAIDQNSRRFLLFFVSMMSTEVIRTIRMGMRGLTLSIIMVSLSSP
jgi:hypothetical protein